jgi:predicted N-formylglutamate amidohydrolase
MPPALLLPGDPAPVLEHNIAARSPFLLTADHAGRAVPQRLGTLGLRQEDLNRHIGWDIGIWGVTQRLADALAAPALGQLYSRLVIDCNRNPAWPGAVPVVSESTEIPANARVSQAARAARTAAIFAPYHDRIEAEITARQPRALIAMHSMTDNYKGERRPWQAAVLFNRHRAFADALAPLLRAEGLTVGENQPYVVTDDNDYSVPVHAERRGLPYLELEIRQDLIADAAGQDYWAKLLAGTIQAAYAAISADGRTG